MSQLYRIQLKTSVSESFTLSDRIVHRLELTNIMPEEEMLDILKQVLKAEGFSEQADGTYTKTGDQDEQIIFDLDNMQVSAAMETEKEVSTEAVAHGQAWDSRKQARENAQSQLKQAEEAAKSQIDTTRVELQRELSAKLEEGEQDRMRELNQILQQVYAESLKRKARQLGDVMEVHESTNQGQYELVIKIEQ